MACAAPAAPQQPCLPTPYAFPSLVAANVRQAQVDKSKFYDGWSCLNQQLVNKHALVNAFSNPKKCQLTLKVGGALGKIR